VASPSLQRGQVDRLPTNVSRPEERLRAGGAAHCATIRTRRLIAATPQYLALSTLCSWPSSGPNGHAAQGWTPLSDGILSHRHQTSPESSARQQTGGKNGRQLLWHAFNAEQGKPSATVRDHVATAAETMMLSASMTWQRAFLERSE